MKRHTAIALACLMALSAMAPTSAWAHCQIPCGIYDDEMVFTQLRQHVTTIEKSMNQINDLSADPSANANQIARWVGNKEAHADDLSEIVLKYFLQQRIKPVDGDDKEAHAGYLAKVEMLHKMTVHSMKAKQTTDTDHCEALLKLINDFYNVYFEKE